MPLIFIYIGIAFIMALAIVAGIVGWIVELVQKGIVALSGESEQRAIVSTGLNRAGRSSPLPLPRESWSQPVALDPHKGNETSLTTGYYDPPEGTVWGQFTTYNEYADFIDDDD